MQLAYISLKKREHHFFYYNCNKGIRIIAYYGAFILLTNEKIYKRKHSFYQQPKYIQNTDGFNYNKKKNGRQFGIDKHSITFHLLVQN